MAPLPMIVTSQRPSTSCRLLHLTIRPCACYTTPEEPFMNGLYYIGSQASMSNRPPSQCNTQSIKVPQLQLFTLTCVPGSSQTTSKCLSSNGLCCIGSRPVKRIGPSPKAAPSWGQSLSCSFKVCGFSPLSYF